MLHRRRFLTTTSSGLALGAVALLLGRGALAQPSYTVPLAQLQEMVAPKFPRSVPVQGLFDLTLQVPLLRLLPEVNRLGATMAVDALAGLAQRHGFEFVLSGQVFGHRGCSHRGLVCWFACCGAATVRQWLRGQNKVRCGHAPGAQAAVAMRSLRAASSSRASSISRSTACMSTSTWSGA